MSIKIKVQFWVESFEIPWSFVKNLPSVSEWFFIIYLRCHLIVVNFTLFWELVQIKKGVTFFYSILVRQYKWGMKSEV